MPEVIPLAEVKELRRIKAITDTDPHVIVTISGWHLGTGRWWFEPTTTSRIGEPTGAGYHVIGSMCEGYGRSLQACGNSRQPRRGRARLRRRKTGRR